MPAYLVRIDCTIEVEATDRNSAYEITRQLTIPLRAHGGLVQVSTPASIDDPDGAAPEILPEVASGIEGEVRESDEYRRKAMDWIRRHYPLLYEKLKKQRQN